MRYEMSDFPADPPVDFQDARLSPASLRGHLQDLERRIFKARRVTVALQVTIALLLVALVVTLARQKKNLLVEDDEGRPRIEANVSDGQALLEFIDSGGVLRASLGESGGAGVFRLYGPTATQGSQLAVELFADPPRLVLWRDESEVVLGLDLGGMPWFRASGRDGETLWSQRETLEGGLHEYRRRSPAPLGL